MVKHVVELNSTIYRDLLKEYIRTQDEKALYQADQVIKSLIKNNIPPEEIVNIHFKSLLELYPDLHEDFRHSSNFLIEMMISYGLAHQEFMNLREEQLKLKSEMAVAAELQKTLLKSSKPTVKGLDIGVISVPARQLNGDYYHFRNDDDRVIGIAIADVIGKGIPAALCMSMVKYSMESLPESVMSPRSILKNLNRVIERNVDSSMFVTMFYTQYFPENGRFRYASAGHEPGFYFNFKEQQFKEIHTKGLVLGVLPEVSFEQRELYLDVGDMIILLTDGVTECRKGDRFIEMNDVLQVIKSYQYLPAQDIVDHVFKYFESLQNFQLRDDFTLIILRKDV